MSVSLNFTVPFPWGQSKVFPVLSRVVNFAASFFFFFSSSFLIGFMYVQILLLLQHPDELSEFSLQPTCHF